MFIFIIAIVAIFIFIRIRTDQVGIYFPYTMVIRYNTWLVYHAPIRVQELRKKYRIVLVSTFHSSFKSLSFPHYKNSDCPKIGNTTEKENSHYTLILA